MNRLCVDFASVECNELKDFKRSADRIWLDLLVELILTDRQQLVTLGRRAA